MRQGELRYGHWWDRGSWWRWHLVSPVGWWLAGMRDRVNRWRHPL